MELVGGTYPVRASVVFRPVTPLANTFVTADAQHTDRHFAMNSAGDLKHV